MEGRRKQIQKVNTPPVITSVKILPENPNKESELSSIIQCEDADGDPVNFSYQWLRNDEEIAGEDKNTLPNRNFKKGDLIRVKVTPFDGKMKGVPFLSPPVKITNSPPVIHEVWIEPKFASVKDTLRVLIKSSDPDGDFIYYSYQWERNGEVLREEGKEVLEPGQFKKGDTIRVQVTPDDREISGSPKKSIPLIISNSPPVIISSPPTSVQGANYLYQVKINDPDGDPVTFILQSGPKGMEINKETGLIRWEIQKVDKGSHPIEIVAVDKDGGRSTQRYTLSVDFK